MLYQVERYDVARNKWEFVGCMCERRYRPAAAAVGKLVHFSFNYQQTKNFQNLHLIFFEIYLCNLKLKHFDVDPDQRYCKKQIRLHHLNILKSFDNFFCKICFQNAHLQFCHVYHSISQLLEMFITNYSLLNISLQCVCFESILFMFWLVFYLSWDPVDY